MAVIAPQSPSAAQLSATVLVSHRPLPDNASRDMHAFETSCLASAAREGEGVLARPLTACCKGYCVVLGSTTRSVPQILRILRNKR